MISFDKNVTFFIISIDFSKNHEILKKFTKSENVHQFLNKSRKSKKLFIHFEQKVHRFSKRVSIFKRVHQFEKSSKNQFSKIVQKSKKNPSILEKSSPKLKKVHQFWKKVH